MESFHVKLSQASLTMVSDEVELIIVKFNVAVLSQPTALVVRYEYVPLWKKVESFHVKLSQALMLVSDVVELRMIKFNVTSESQPTLLVSKWEAELLDSV